MSAPAAPAPAQGPAPRSASASSAYVDDALVQAEPRRPRDFGIDVDRLRRMRRIVFAILALPILVLSLLAIRFVTMPITQAWSTSAYDDKHYAEASDRLWPVDHANWFEPYLPHLTRGTDLLQEGKDAAAEKELRRSLEIWEGSRDLNQPAHAECKIRNNLAIAIERQADAIQDPAQRGDRLHEAEQAMGPCSGGGGSGNEDGKTTGGNGKRIEDKRKQADKEAGREDRGDDPGTPPPNQDPNPDNHPKHEDPSGTKPPEEAPTQGDSTDSSKQDQLDERNQSANNGDGDESSGGAQQSPSKPW